MGCESGMQASYRPARYAAIDIGTVTCRMLVADVDAQGHLSELDREYAIANLGEGVNATGVLKPQAIQRVVDIVDGYCRVRDGFSGSEDGAIETVAVATSASRDAKKRRRVRRCAAGRRCEAFRHSRRKGSGAVVFRRIVRFRWRKPYGRGHRRWLDGSVVGRAGQALCGRIRSTSGVAASPKNLSITMSRRSKSLIRRARGFTKA